jgi:DNA-binding LytR/AlgR family response regulator
MDKILKVFIADDSKIMREHIAPLLSVIPKFKITGQAEEVPEAIRFIEKPKLPYPDNWQTKLNCIKTRRNLNPYGTDQ